MSVQVCSPYLTSWHELRDSSTKISLIEDGAVRAIISIDPIWPEHVVRNIQSDLIPPNSNQTRNIVKSSTDSTDT
jgi:hypothetical protein